MYELGNLKLKSRIFLAPMLEPNDIAFRLLCQRCGSGLNFTGMTSPFSKHEIHLDDKPAMQLFGNSPRGIRAFLKKYDDKVSMWDFNLGCPSTSSEKMGHGAYMHEDLETIGKVFFYMRKNTAKPCSVKLRKSPNALKIAKMAEDAGFDMVTIHPRTFKQGYSGKADYDYALKMKEELKIPVCYSGDVNEKNIAVILKDFDFVMIGRSAIGNPNIFGGEKVGFLDYLKLALKYGIYFRQIKFQAMCFTKGEVSARSMRRDLVYAKNLEEVEKVFIKSLN